ncbi:MAG: AAC(3) family N-acetyltransferase [Ignavibacteriales bacterium]|nr:AAC(3) family N-acetyltransferase [Ignavibacteriales bacterium]
MMTFKEFLIEIGLKGNANVLVHSSYLKIRSAFPNISMDRIIGSIQDVLTEKGSLIMPTFTYCFKRLDGSNEIFNRLNSKSKTGAITEAFRKYSDVKRTSSPTHSFALWGNVTKYFDEINSPTSPLGKGSIMEWLVERENSYILMLGVDFTSFTLGHYVELKAPVPWSNYSPWDYLGVLKIGVSVYGEQNLIEVPGCAKSFVNFEKYLIEKNIIKNNSEKNMNYYYFNAKQIYEEGIKYFKDNSEELLCPMGSCLACDSRREKFLV